MLPGQRLSHSVDEWMNAGTILMMAGSEKFENSKLCINARRWTTAGGPVERTAISEETLANEDGNAVRCHGVRHACHGLA